MIHSLAELYKWHPALCGAILMALANAAITSLPSPDGESTKLYRWFFNFSHAAILGISRIAAQYRDGKPVAPGGDS